MKKKIMLEDSPSTAHATAIPSSPPLHPRYRAFSPTSSEPPLFSSDDPPEAADILNYESPRFKRKRAGPWWETERDPGRVKKARMERNYDSGIWMGSESSTSSLPALDGINDNIFSEQGLPDNTQQDEEHEESEEERLEREIGTMSDAAASMYHYIQRAIDSTNNDHYDLSGRKLRDEDLSPIRLLNQVIKVPLDAGVDVPGEGQYRSFEPALYVNLADNLLSDLAPSLFDLEHLKSLVLRNNNIKHLPPQITKLARLTELDLSRNKIEFLPVELLSLLQDCRIQLLGNPILEPIKNRTVERLTALYEVYSKTVSSRTSWRELLASYSDDDQALLMWIAKENEIARSPRAVAPFHQHWPVAEEYAFRRTMDLMARTPPSYFDQVGRLVRGSPAPPSSSTPFAVLIETEAYGTWGMPDEWFEPKARSKAPSLFAASFNIALNCASPDVVQEEIQRYLGEDSDIPLKIADHISVAKDYLAKTCTQFRQCHCCGKDYLIPRASWIEFWRHYTSDILPIKVEVCSWGCVPEAIAKKPQHENK